jgi:hypothetical protein
MPRDEELPIIRVFYDFVLWLNQSGKGAGI